MKHKQIAICQLVWDGSRIQMKKHAALFRQQYALECKTHPGPRKRYARKKIRCR